MNQDFRVTTGIVGLDHILFGGFIKNSINTIVGGSGTGKTTMALKYIYEGVKLGEHVLYISFEEEPTKLIKEAKSLGINFYDLTDNPEDLIHMVESEKIVEFMTSVLPVLSNKLKNQKIKHTRVVLDPLTPFLWEFSSERELRKVLTKVYYHLRTLGTIFQTVEEVQVFGNTNMENKEIRVPLYLSDAIIHIQNLGFSSIYSRTCRVIKSRQTPHLEGLFPVKFVYGPGIVINTIENANNAKEIEDEKLENILKQINKWEKEKDTKRRVIARLAKKVYLTDKITSKREKYQILSTIINPEVVKEV